jgi:uncharacterized protein (TIGR03067 family)
MKWIALMLLMTGLVVAADDPKPEDVKKEVAKFQGTWKITKIEREGDDLTDEIGDAELEVKGEEYTAPTIAAKFKMDPSKKPKAIDVSYTEGPNAGQTVKAIYKFDGDTFTMCRALTDAGPRPTEFAAPAGSGKMCIVLKKK